MKLSVNVVSNNIHQNPEKITENIENLLHASHDYRSGNIQVYQSMTGQSIQVDIYPDDFSDHVRSREAILSLMQFIIENYI